MTQKVTVIDHPMVQHKLTLLRQKERSTNSFRTLLSEISMLLAYEVTRDLPLVYQEIETPLVATADWGYVRLRQVNYEGPALKEWAGAVAAQP